MRKPDSQNKTFSKLRVKAKEKLKTAKKGPEKRKAPDLEHELNVHEIELKMQNEELLAIQTKLTTSLEQYEELFELSPTGYFILDKNGVIEKVNERGSAQLGIEKANLVGKPFSTFLHGENQQDNFYRHRNIVVESEQLHHLECQIKRKDGSLFSALLKSIVVKNAEHKFKHLISIVSDISKIREHERQIELALLKSQELNEMKSRFITMASHEFRTPLATVLSSTSLVEQYAQTGQDEKIKKHLNRIRSSVKDLTTILDEFLSIEKLESGKVDIVKASFSLPEFCEELIDDVRSLLKKGQDIKYTHNGDNEIIEDKKIVQHVLLNLLSNACKYSGEDKEIYLYTEVGVDKVCLTIEDHGIGIPIDDQKNLFTRFFRAKNAIAIQGTGLGLNIVKRYVELINGTIAFTSKPNEGTTFSVEFPKNNF